MLGSMTNVIKLDDITHYRSLDDVPEVLRLAAHISSNKDGECLIHANKLQQEIEQSDNQYLPRYDGARRKNCHQKRPIDVKRAFEKVKALLYSEEGRFELNSTDTVVTFFKTAVSAGYKTKKELAELLDISNTGDFEVIADYTRSKRIFVEASIAVGRIKKREKLTPTAPSPSPSPRAAGQGPR